MTRRQRTNAVLIGHGTDYVSRLSQNGTSNWSRALWFQESLAFSNQCPMSKSPLIASRFRRSGAITTGVGYASTF